MLLADIAELLAHQPELLRAHQPHLQSPPDGLVRGSMKVGRLEVNRRPTMLMFLAGRDALPVTG